MTMHSLGVEKKPRLLHIEVLRLIAIFMVMFNHSDTEGYLYFSVLTNYPRQLIAAMISVSAKIAAPLFFMISGALLLGRQESIAAVLKKRLCRFLLILLVISGVYGVFHMKVDGWTLGTWEWIDMIYGNEMHFTLWYLYSYLCFLTMLPFLRRLAQSMEGREYAYLAGMGLLFSGVLPVAEFLLFRNGIHINSSLQGPVFVAINMFYPLMGYYMEHVMPRQWLQWKGVLVSLGAAALALAVTGALAIYKMNVTGLTIGAELESFHSAFIAIPTFAAYICAKAFFQWVKTPEPVQALLTTAGSAVFGVYLLEYVLKYAMSPVESWLHQAMAAPVANILWILSLMTVGVIVVTLLKKLPVVGKLV